MSLALAKEVLSLEAEGILTVRDRLGPEFEQAVDLLAACSSRIVVTGIGKSGLIGQKICATLNSTGSAASFLHPVEAMHGDLGMVCSADVVVAISYSGETVELNRLLHYLRERAVPVIAICGRIDSTLSARAQVTLNVAVLKEACPLGLAPTTSTTATLAMGDALAVALLTRKRFQAEDFRKNHPGGSLGERLKVAVGEVMLTGARVPTVTLAATMADMIAELNAKNLGAVFVTDAGERLVGIVTDGDLRRLVSASTHFDEMRLAEVMTPAPIAIAPTLMAADALSLMQQYEITVLAVTGDQGRLMGILHLHDLLGKGEFRFLI